MLGMMLIGGFFAGGAFTWISSDISVPSGWSTTVGTVTDIRQSSSSDGTTYSPIISFESNGQEYVSRSNLYTSSKPSLGGERQVAFNPENPSQNKVVGNLASLWVVVLGGLIGIVLFILGPILFINSKRRMKVIDELMKTGHKVTGVVSAVRKTGSENNRDNYKIIVTAAGLDGVVREYASDKVVNVGGLMASGFESKPVPVDVYLSTSNPNLYYVDIDDIPELTAESIEGYIKIFNKDGK